MPKIQAKKKLSQNFLVDTKISQKVVQNWLRLFQNNPNLKYFLEIGPGTGCLTKPLLASQEKVLAVEIDPDLIHFLESQLSGYNNLELIQADGMKLEYQNLGDFLLVSNLPYQIGSRLLIEFSILRPELPFSVILQKEVANKFTFKDNFTLFACWLNLFYQTQVLFNIPREGFEPKPRVTSSLLEAVPKPLPSPLLDTETKRKQAFIKLKKLFNNPRKSLANNLKNLNWDKTKIQSFLDKMSVTKDFRWDFKNYPEVFLAILENS